jgi:formate dehydrogenase iron-sulfur subunit
MPVVLYINLERCIDCRACEVACEREHAGRSNMFVQRFADRFSLPLSCRHCETSFCTIVCPTGALARSEDGIVLISPMKCIGCRQCMLACPFGAIWFDVKDKIARKCDLCIHRLEQNLEPACVATCSAKALDFGRWDDLASSTLLAKGHTIVHRAAGTWGTLITLPHDWDRSSGLERS